MTTSPLVQKLLSNGWTAVDVSGVTKYTKIGHGTFDAYTAALSQVHEEYLTDKGWVFSGHSWRLAGDLSSFSSVAFAMRRQAHLDGFNTQAFQQARESYLKANGWHFNGTSWSNPALSCSFANIKTACRRQESLDWVASRPRLLAA